MSVVIEVENDGWKVKRSNYWETQFAEAGLALLSWHGSAARLLLPPAMYGEDLDEMRTAKLVVLTMGLWPINDRIRPALEILFDDGSATPYYIRIIEEAHWPLPTVEDINCRVHFSAWTEAGLALDIPGVLIAAPFLAKLTKDER